MGNQSASITPQGARGREYDEKEEEDWIKKNLTMKTCRTVIVENNKSDKCMCGQYVKLHTHSDHDPTGRKWTSTKDTEMEPTNAFGEMEFDGFGEFRSNSKFVRVSDDTDMDKMFELMTVHWGLGEPKLFISVTGSAKNYKLPSRDTKLFKQGLMRAAVSAGAWIITGGSNEGVMKHVGEAVHDYRLTSKKTSNDVVAIGIGTWGCIQNRDKLERHKHRDGLALYRNEQEAGASGTYLNPDYTHFILVDDGSQNQWGKEIDFRGNLQQKVSSTYMAQTFLGNKKRKLFREGLQRRISLHSSKAVKIPVVTIVVQGGYNTLETVRDSVVVHNIPIVTIEGSGEVADMIVDAYNSAGKNGGKVSLDVENNIREQLITMVTGFGKQDLTKEKEQQADNLYKTLLNIISKRHLVSVHKLSSFEDKGLDLTILEALVKAKDGHHHIYQLTLALHWNRIDFVKKNKIELDDGEWEEAAPDLMMSALKLNRVDFVEMYLANGIQMQKFLTKDRLKSLYIDKECHIAIRNFDETLKNLDCETGDFLEKLDALLQGMIGNVYTSNPESEALDDPCQHLFIWCVVMNRMEMAKVWWRQIKKNPIAAALVASALLNNMAEESDDDVQLKELKKSSVEFSRLAIDVANMCYEEDENKAHQLLDQKLDEWGGVTCLELAAETENKHFISQTSCKTYLHRLWMGKLSYTTKKKELILPTLLPFLIFKLTKFNGHFQSKKKFMKQRIEDPGKWRCMDCCLHIYFYLHQIVCFYSSPVIKFLMHVVSYIAFLAYFSLILLVEFDSTFRIYDVVLIIWVVSIFIEEMIQFVRRHKISCSCCGRNNSRRSSGICQSHTVTWTIVDITAFSLFLLAMVVRLANPEKTINGARLILGLDLMLFYFRSIHILSAHQKLGPKIVMIAHMFVDLLYFLVILMIFVLAYAIASYSILYPNSLLDGDLFMKVARTAYWNLYGEIMVDEIEMKEPECTFNPALYENGTLPRCATEIGTYVVPILMGIYVMFSNILLLNLLIAMFSNTFNRIQAKTDLLWHYQRYYLVYEYLSLSPFPSPVVILYHIYLLVRNLVLWCVKCTGKIMEPKVDEEARRDAENKKLDTKNTRSHWDRYNKANARFRRDNTKKMLQAWERILASHYVDNNATSQQDKSESETGTQSGNETDNNEKTILSRRMHSLEDKITEISRALSSLRMFLVSAVGENEGTRGTSYDERFESGLEDWKKQMDADAESVSVEVVLDKKKEKKKKKKKDKKSKKEKKERKTDDESD